jgi:hypothetical protein
MKYTSEKTSTGEMPLFAILDAPPHPQMTLALANSRNVRRESMGTITSTSARITDCFQSALELWRPGWEKIGVDAFTERVVSRKVAVSINRDRPDGVIVESIPIQR